MRRNYALIITVISAVVLLVGCGSTTSPVTPAPATGTSTSSATVDLRTTPAPWDRPTNQETMVKAAGLVLTPTETLTVHYHAHLDVIVDDTPVPVPAGLGINAAVGDAPAPHGSPGIAPLHTHDTTGILHIEAPRKDTFTLGQVFTEWGVAFGAGRLGAYTTGNEGRQVAVYVNGKRTSTDPSRIVLAPHQQIAVIAPAPPHVNVPASYVFPPSL